MDRVSTQSGKHRHVSKNTVTKSRLYTRQSNIIRMWDLPEPDQRPVKSEEMKKPRLLRRVWDFCRKRVAGK